MGHVRSLYFIREFPNTCILGNNGMKSLLSTLPINGIREFRTSIFKKSRWPNKSSNLKPKIEPITPYEGIKIENGPVHISNLWKPLGFTVLVTSGSFVFATIWQYENMRARAESLIRQPNAWIQEKFYGRKKYGSWRNELNNWWNGLTEGQKLFFPICFANCLVFLAWKVPYLQGTMLRYFCSNPASRILCWPMILSTFSHYSTFHLLANMYVLHSFSTGAVESLGKEQFLGLYLSAGVISSMSSYVYKAFTKPGLSLGASGAIMAVLGYVCTQFPDKKLCIILLPYFTFSADTAIKVIMGLDLAGVILGWKFFDHAAHLGGALTGIAWSYWGNTYIWQKREPLLRWWHDLRGSPVK